MGLTILLNLVMLPLYLALFFFPPFNVIMFAVANGVLLGREYFEAVALRHMSLADAKALRFRMRKEVWLAGSLAAFLLVVPGLNLTVPVIASGGITCLEDIRALCAVADEGIVGAITGRAIYQGTLAFAEAQKLADELSKKTSEA